jgi:hypothetical protein
MNSKQAHTLALSALVAASFTGSLPAQAQGYYINPTMYSNMYAVNATQLAQNLQFAARMKTLREQQAIFESVSKAGKAKTHAASNEAPATPSAPFTATDFKPTGRRDAPQRLAAMVEDPALRPQIAQLARDILGAIEQEPAFRKNNLAYALTIYFGGSLQVLTGEEIDDARSQALAQWLNNEMVAAGAVAKLSSAQRTQLYDVLLLQGGLIIGIAQAGAENGDAEQVEIAKKMAREALTTFGITL